jgi:NADH dehydrogenase/NADH:ubiquinone oxidoreductase subunit G
LQHLDYKTDDLILFNTHNINNLNLEVNNNFYLLPIASHFEMTNTLVNVEGKIQRGYKATSLPQSQTKIFSDILESFTNFKDEYLNFLSKNHSFVYFESVD